MNHEMEMMKVKWTEVVQQPAVHCILNLPGRETTYTRETYCDSMDLYQGS